MSTPTASSSHTPASIHLLPDELTEHVLIFSAAGRFPTAISALAQTCRGFYALVYHAPDQHLWREVFLTTFDDPRQSEGGEKEKESPFDWGKEFRRRVWAMNYLRRTTTDVDAYPAPSSPSNYVLDSTVSAGAQSHSPTVDLAVNAHVARDLRALETLISVVRTALPFPPTIIYSFLPQPSTNTTPGIVPTYPAYPIFPPQPHSTEPGSRTPAAPFSAVSLSPRSSSSSCTGTCSASGCSATSAASSATSTCTSSSLNIAWFEEALRRGLPPGLAQKLSGTQWEGGLMGQELSALEGRRMQALGRVVAYTGFLPVPPPGEETGGHSEASGADDSFDEEDTIDVQRMSSVRSSEQEDFITRTEEEEEEEEGGAAGTNADGTQSPEMSVAAQNRRARRLARMRVYNLRYLSAHRHWGPFMPVQGSGGKPHSAWEEMQSYEEMFDDAQRVLGGDLEEYSAPDGEEEEEEDEEDEEDEEEEEEEGEWSALHSQAHGDLPTPAELEPDWVYLAAVRVVVEANLREAVGTAELGGLVSLDGLRAGSAPKDICMGGFQRVIAPEPDALSCAKKGKRIAGLPIDGLAMQPACPTGEGWDWAGVTGVWRRCICWLDYRDLILQNLSSGFNDPQLSEAVRIVPMRLRVASYSPSSVPTYPDRPTIYISGETSSSGGNGQLRKLKGSVCVLADGSVRWTIVLVGENEGDPDEWITEGVQIGGITSAMGVLGMWTGSQHERMDPLGPFWAWKVG